jgi:hypothetical protein
MVQLAVLNDSTSVLPFGEMGATAFGALVCAVVSAVIVTLLVDAFSNFRRGTRQRRVFEQWATENLGLHVRHPEARGPTDTEPQKRPSDLAHSLARLVGSGVGDPDRLFSLPPRQLCAQLAVGLQAEAALAFADRAQLINAFAPALDDRWTYSTIQSQVPGVGPFGGSNESEGETSELLAAAAQFLTYSLERGLDQFQQTLEQYWRRFELRVSVVMAALLIGLLYEAVAPRAFPVWVSQPTVVVSLTILAVLTFLLVPFMRRVLARLSRIAG